MDIDLYEEQSALEGRNFGALAVLWPLLEKMGVAELINQHLPIDPQAEYDHGTVLSLLVAARLYSPVALVNVASWAAETGADILWKIPAAKLTDDRLGKAVEAFFSQRHSILGSLALRVAEKFGVSLNEIHYDPTHVLLHGAYEKSEPRDPFVPGETIRSDDQLPPAHITAGRAMSDAPKDIRMIHVGLCTIVDEFGGLPIFGHTVAGNHNGHTAVVEQMALLKKHVKLTELTLISDRGTFSAGHLVRLKNDGFHALAAAPWGDFQTLFDEQRKKLTWKRASYLSLEQQRRRTQGNLPQEHYDLAVVKHTLQDDSSGQELPCRVLFVFSTADQKVAQKTREKSIAKLREGLEQVQRSVAEGRRFSDPTAVARRVTKLLGERKAGRYFTYEMQLLTKKEREQLPKPPRGCKVASHRFVFHYDDAAAKRDAEYEGYSALVTTAPLTMSCDQAFTKYKQQAYSELANHEFKTPLAVHPIFLKSPQRVEALVFLLMITLTLYYLLQRMYRQTTPEDATPKQKRTTTEQILRAFHSYILLIRHTKTGRIVQPTQLTTRQREILQQLGFPTPAQILSRRLARAP